MKKILNVVFKIVFSRTMITILLLLVQVFWLFAGFKWLGRYSRWTMLLMTVLSVGLLVYIINKDEVPEFKLAWVIPICAFPLFGGLLYVFIVGNFGNIGLRREINRRIEETGTFRHTDERTRQKLAQGDPHQRNLCHYIEKTGGFPAYSDSAATYFPLGEDKLKDLLTELEKAEEFIFLEYFIVERGRMWDSVLEILKRKAQEGVEVRFMYDGMCSLLLLPYSYPKKLNACGIRTKMFAPIVPLLSTAQNNRDHRKILVIDGKAAYTGGVNMADEYINEKVKYGHWKDVAVRVDGDAVRSFTLMFLQLWNSSEKGMEDYERYLRKDLRPKGKTAGLVIPYGDGPTTPENVAETLYLDLINHAERYLHIMTPYFIVDNAMLDALQFAARRGVEVKLVIPHIPDKKAIFAMSRTYYPDLLSAGIRVYEYTPGFVHAKVFVSDDTKATVGTVNLDYRSLYHHFECGVYFYGHEVIAAIERDFQETTAKCMEADLAYYKKIPAFNRLTGRVLRLCGPLM